MRKHEAQRQVGRQAQFRDNRFEVVAIGALVMCLTFVFVNLGGPLQAWHMIPVIGLFNWPTSLLTWDVVVLNGYLALNLMVPAYILFCHYHNRKPNERLYRPFVFLSIFWAFGIHLVTAFLYQGLPARPFWNNPLMGPRFLASAFAAGPALITVVLVIITGRIVPLFTRNELEDDTIRMNYDVPLYAGRQERDPCGFAAQNDALVVHAGTIGSVARFHYSFMGATDPTQMEQEARNLATVMKKDRVDTVLLVPV